MSVRSFVQQAVRAARRRSLRRGFYFPPTYEEGLAFMGLSEDTLPDTCPFLNTPLLYEHRPLSSPDWHRVASIDRKRNDEGYHAGNVRWVSSAANRMMSLHNEYQTALLCERFLDNMRTQNDNTTD